MDWREGRRRRAWALKQAGWKQKDIASALGVTEGAVSQWIKRGEAGGEESLKHQPPPGVPARLSVEQRQALIKHLEKGPASYGFSGDIWTQARVATVIRQEFGVVYSARQAGRILKQIVWSLQKPGRRASQRNESAIRVWQDQWAEVKKKS